MQPGPAAGPLNAARSSVPAAECSQVPTICSLCRSAIQGSVPRCQYQQDHQRSVIAPGQQSTVGSVGRVLGRYAFARDGIKENLQIIAIIFNSTIFRFKGEKQNLINDINAQLLTMKS